MARDEGRKCLKSVIDGVEGIDMDRMRRLLRKQLRETMASLESDPHHAIAFRCIGDALYSQNENDFISRMNPQHSLNELLKEGEDYWLCLWKKYFDNDLVTVVGSPSIELQAKIAEDELNRIAEQRAQLGEEGLAEKGKLLEEAMEFNERPPPPGTLASVPVPSCENLKCHKISSWNSFSEPCPYFDVKAIPMYARVHSLNTNFVYCEPDDYEEVVNHLYEVLNTAEITKERLLVFAQRLINDVSQVRRNGHKMVYDILRDSLYSKDSNVHWSSVLRQQKFLKELIDQLNAGGDSAEAAINEAKQTFKTLTGNAWLHLSADLVKYKLGSEPWKRFARENEITFMKPNLYWDADLMTGWGGGVVVGVGGLDSSFVVQSSEGPLGNAFVDFAPLIVALNYFTQLEGPMWRLIRGGGLSYGYGIRPSPNEGRLVFSLYRATNAVAAYTKAKNIVDEYLADHKFDEDLFASAKSTALFEVVENEKCVADVVTQSLINYIRQATETYNRDLVCAIAAVTEAEVHAAATRWLPRMFQTDTCKVAVVCHPTKVADMQAAFGKINVRLDAFDSMETSHFNK
ncbi:jg18457 [Pararge aegeria aegeria]|uniref:Jg18457 protein n=2 Tax=Pararge aegeria TaxID=116150 RepID=A0A8S4RLB2_9NEOP|nr:jg18457 [Pararge aegeria aegeria]